MSRAIGIAMLLVGLVAVVVGLMLQAGGAAAVVFCSVIGGGMLLAIIGFGAWAIEAWSHRPPARVAR
jgi:cation transporter-like permease